MGGANDNDWQTYRNNIIFINFSKSDSFLLLFKEYIIRFSPYNQLG